MKPSVARILPLLCLAFGVFELIIATGSLPAQNNVYIAQTATGGANGADCNDALAYTYFNSSDNWTSGTPTGTKIGPGTTVHLCGTFTASAGTSGLLQFQGNGSAGSPVTLYFETGAQLSAPYWGQKGAIYDGSGSYITVNGGTNGLIQATACGTGLTDCQTAADPQTTGIYFTSCSSCVVENLTISDIYVHTTANITGGCAAGGNSGMDECGQNSYAIYWTGGSNSQLENNKIHDAKWCIYDAYPGGTTTSNDTIGPSNTVYDCDHDAVFGDGNSNAIGNNLTIYGNTFHDWQNWDDALNYNHHDGIHVWAVHSGSKVTGLMVYNNYIYGNGGIGINSWIFDDDESGGIGTDSYLFNNVLVDSGTVSHQGCGMICNEDTSPSVFDNTVVGAGTSWGVGLNFYGQGVTFQNNVVENIETAAQVESGATVSLADYNDYYNYSGGGGANGFNFKNAWTGIFSSWQADCACDGHSMVSNPSLGGNYVPNAGSPLIEFASNLTDLDVAPLDSDMAGVPRPTGTCSKQGSSSCWTIGAYQPATSSMMPPTNLGAVAH
jgi:hypothetical protein